MSVITVLRIRRIELGLTLDEVSLLAGGKPGASQLSRAERGFYRLSEKELEAVCGVLGIGVAEAVASIQHVVERARAELRAAVACPA